MPESYIQLPADSTGKKAHTFQRTIGSNTVEDEAVLLGEQYLATYAVESLATSIATVNDHVLQIMAGASLNVYVRRIVVTQAIVATTAALFGMSVVRLSTAGTGGTVRTPSAFDTADAAAGASAMTLPTSKGTEGVELFRHYASAIQTVAVGGPASATIVFDFDVDKLRTKAIRIPAGTANGIAVKILNAVAGAQANVWALISEANF